MELNILFLYGRENEGWSKLEAYFNRRNRAVAYTASSVPEVLKLLKYRDLNIIIADYDMDRLNPTTFIKRARSIKPSVEIIFLSEKASLSKAIGSMREGAYDFFEFPVNIRLLVAVIEKALEKQVLYFEKKDLENKVREKFEFGNIIGNGKAMQNVMGLISSVAPKNVNILITGETGTGKELVANAIHYHSPRASKPLVKVNCAAFNEGVLESELFGHERGAFTNAFAQRVGRFEFANGGTLFLDEVGDLPQGTQVKLLRVLQEKEFERVGGNEPVKVDLRFIAATNQDLTALIEQNRFRRDLYYRLNVVHIELPPLRERKEDIPHLVNFFIEKLNEEKEYNISGIEREAVRMLIDYDWPGNVRELENTLESAMALSTESLIQAKSLPSILFVSAAEDSHFYHIPRNLTLEEIKNEVIRLALQKTKGNRTEAARILGIGLRTLQRRMRSLQK